MSIAFVQAPTGASGNSSAPANTFGAPTTAGNFLVAIITCSSGTITGPAGWTAGPTKTGGAGDTIAAFTLANAASITTVTAGLSGATRWTVELAEFSGLGTTPTLETSNTGTTDSGAVTTSNADLLIAGLAGISGTFSSPGGGFTLQSQATVASITSALLWQIAGAGTYTASASGVTANAGIIAAFTAAGATAPPPRAPLAVRVARRAAFAGAVAFTTPLSRPHIGGSARTPGAVTAVAMVRRPPVVGRVVRAVLPPLILPANRAALVPRIVRPVPLVAPPRGRPIRLIRQTHSAATGVRARHSIIVRPVAVRAPLGRVHAAPRPPLILPTNRPVRWPRIVYGPHRRRAEWLAGRPAVGLILPLSVVPPTGFPAAVPRILRPTPISPIPRGRFVATLLPPNGVPPELTNPQCRVFRPSWQAWQWRTTAAARMTAVRMAAGPASIASTALIYHVYGNDGMGGPIDYSTPLVATRDTTWSTGILGPGDYWWGVRVEDPTIGLEETNVDARVELILDSNLIDITRRPVAPYGLTAIPLAGAAVRVRWNWRPGDNGVSPAGWRVWATSQAAGSGITPTVDYSAAPTKTYAYTGLMATYSVDLAGLTDGTVYAIGVRSFDSAGQVEPNVIQVIVTADGTAPGDVGGLLATVVAGGP